MEGGIFGRIRIGLMGMGERLCYMLSVAESRGEIGPKLPGWKCRCACAWCIPIKSKSGKWLKQISRKREAERLERNGEDYKDTEMEGRHIDQAFLFHAWDMRTGRRHNRAVRIMVVVQYGRGVAPASR